MIDDDKELDRWIEALLKSPHVRQSESPPAALVRSITVSVTRRRRKRRYAACGLSVAAMLLVAVSWGTQGNRQAVDMPDKIAVARGNTAPAVFNGGDDMIAVPIASRYPNVSIFRVYPVCRIGAMANVDTGDLPTDEESIWTENINGG